MKKLILSLMTLAISLGASAGNPLGNLLGGLTGNSSGDSASDAISGLVSGLLGNKKVTLENMVGTWSYTGPAVCFQSENFLQQAGGAAAAGTIEGKLKPYYNKLKLNKMTLTVNEDGTFSMGTGKMQATGTITFNGDEIYFNFTAMGQISLGKVRAYVTQTANTMSVMFDATKLVNIVKTVASVSNNASVSAVSSLLQSYDGICVGFKLKK